MLAMRPSANPERRRWRPPRQRARRTRRQTPRRPVAAASPVAARECVADLDLGADALAQEEPGVADQRAARALDHRPEREPVRRLVRRVSGEHPARLGLSADRPVADVEHDLRVGVHAVRVGDVGFGELAQLEPVGAERKLDGHTDIFHPPPLRTCVRLVRRAPQPFRLLVPRWRVLARGAGGRCGGAGVRRAGADRPQHGLGLDGVRGGGGGPRPEGDPRCGDRPGGADRAPGCATTRSVAT